MNWLLRVFLNPPKCILTLLLMSATGLGATGLLLVPHSSLAQSSPPATTLPNLGTDQRQARLRTLYDSLKKTQDPNEIDSVQREIWTIWLHHGNPEIDNLMSQVMTARRESNYERAIALTDKVIELAPDYAEGWNQRATLHFLRESYEESLRDVAETLRLEPNHFGALSGRGLIRMRQGKPALAIQNILEALKVNPHLHERQLLKALGYSETNT
ncbi:MAG: hypothetical protein WA888_22165 [Burkholderiaceae bacterium]